MKVFRLTKKKYAEELSGKGAAKSGARWNSKGNELIYCAENRALAMAEVLVHISLANLSNQYMMMEIHIPDTIRPIIITESDLPNDWNRFPPPEFTQEFGDSFIEKGKSCVLKVPSSVVQGDFNILINPKHHDFEGVCIADVKDFRFDDRLFVS